MGACFCPFRLIIPALIRIVCSDNQSCSPRDCSSDFELLLLELKLEAWPGHASKGCSGQKV